MPIDQTAYVMLDANALLHYQRPDQIDWQALMSCPSVNLLVTPVLLHELEEQKVKNRSRKLRERADAIVSWVASFIESDAPLEIREGVHFVFIRHSPQIDYAAHRLSRAVYDDELIANAIEFKREYACDVTFFTADTGLRLKLPAHGMSAVIPPAKFKLADEPDEAEKENIRLKSELSRLANRLPRLDLSFFGGAPKWSLRTIRNAVDETEPEHPPPFGTNDYEYDRYVKDLNDWKVEARFATAFQIRLRNLGNAVATNIRIELSFPEFVSAKMLRRQPRVPNFLRMPHLRTNITLPNEGAPEYSDDENAVAFHIKNLVHNRSFESELTWLRFVNEDAISNFSAEYVITCVENIEPIQGTLHFTVEGWKQT